MYDLADYGAMLAHRARTDAYAKAIARAVKPGDVVVEIGCGPALFSLLACRAGAKRVYAIESNESVAFARELVAANSCSAQVDILHGSSTQLSLPERANVILSDIRGTLPLVAGCVDSIEDARTRLLAPGGVMIPDRDVLCAALASVPEYYASLLAPWEDSGNGVRLSPMIERVLNCTYAVAFEAEKLMSNAVEWCELDYRAGARARAAATVRLQAARDGVAHGVCLWFRTTLFEDIGYSTAPGQPDNVYGQLFLPWREPVELTAGEEVTVDLHADLVGGNYIWRWESRFAPGNGQPGRVFTQSTLESAAFSAEGLRRRSAGFVPKLSESAAAECWVMQSMNGERSVQEIAAEAAQRFPAVFRNSQEAFQAVSRLADKFAL
jgi:PRMT5 arginine-N-methyltransferase/ribosomal protein L11 methyltransferase PrmA